MSLSKLNSVSRSDSFSDRVCDDLSELILNYLPLKDKFRYECVSKQFQKTIYERHYELYINHMLCYPRDLNAFECIVKKLSNIKCVVNNCNKSLPFWWNNNPNNSHLNLIIKYCNNLNEFYCSLEGISESMKASFLQKFGPKLRSIFVDKSDIKFINNSINNLGVINSSDSISGKVFNRISDLKLKHLKKLSLNIDLRNYGSNLISIEEIEDISQSIHRLFEYYKNITHFTINTRLFSEKHMESLFKGISQLNKLINLKLHSSYFREIYSLELIISGLKQLSFNCPKLRSLSVIYCLKVNKESQLIQFFTQFKAFKQLKRLNINCRFAGMDSPLIEFCSDNYFKSGFENLTHLRISTFLKFTDLRFEEKLLEDIDKCLPKLQELVIKTIIRVTEQTAYTLCRLLKLETLELTISSYEPFWETYEYKINENFRKIKSIRFYFNKI